MAHTITSSQRGFVSSSSGVIVVHDNSLTTSDISHCNSLLHDFSSDERKNEPNDVIAKIVNAYGGDRPVAVLDLKAGTWATTPNQACRSCYLARRLSQRAQQICMSSDHKAARNCYNTGGCGIYKCLNLGLIEFVIPIKRFDKNPLYSNPTVVAVLCSGQYVSGWHKPNEELCFDDVQTDVQTEILRSLSHVRHLESDAHGIPFRMKAVSKVLEELSVNNKYMYRIADEDISHLQNLLENEISPVTSIGRILQDARTPEFAPLNTPSRSILAEVNVQSILGSTYFRNRNHTANFYDLFEWSKSLQSGPAFTWQRWAYSILDNYESDDSPVSDSEFLKDPVSVLRNYSHHLKEISFSKCFGVSDLTNSRTLCDMMFKYKAWPTARLSGHAKTIENFPNTNPGLKLVTEGQWTAHPSQEILERCKNWLDHSLNCFDDLQNVPTTSDWLPLRNELCTLKNSTVSEKQLLPSDILIGKLRLFSKPVAAIHAIKFKMFDQAFKAIYDTNGISSRSLQALIESIDWLCRIPVDQVNIRKNEFYDFFVLRAQPTHLNNVFKNSQTP